MSKEVIAVDVAEVVLPFADSFVKFRNDLTGSRVRRPEFLTYEFRHVLRVPANEVDKRVNDFPEVGNDQAKQLTEARRALGQLARTNELVVISPPEPRFTPSVNVWLAEQFPGTFGPVTLIDQDRTLKEPERLRDKAERYRELGAVALIDHSVSQLEQANRVGVEGILFGEYTWNQTAELPAGVIRCADWPAVSAYFDERT